MEKQVKTKKCWFEFFFIDGSIKTNDVFVKDIDFINDENIIIYNTTTKTPIYKNYQNCNGLYLFINGEKYEHFYTNEYNLIDVELKFRKANH